jgi:hypothetical protein
MFEMVYHVSLLINRKKDDFKIKTVYLLTLYGPVTPHWRPLQAERYDPVTPTWRPHIGISLL